MISKNALLGLRAPALILGLALASGCATNTAVEQAGADAQQALEVAEEARRIAREAADTARSAQESADGAQRCCDNQEERLNRALDRIQQK